MPGLVFSSDELPDDLDEDTKFKRWHDMYAERFGVIDMTPIRNQRFQAHIEVAQFGSIGFAGGSAGLAKASRRAEHIANDGHSDFMLGIATSARSTGAAVQRGRELSIGDGSFVLYSMADPFESHYKEGSDFVGLTLPVAQLKALVPDVDDLVVNDIDFRTPAAQYLVRFLETLKDPSAIAADVGLVASIETMLFDLVALSVGASRDAAEIAKHRGLRAVRLQAVLSELKAGFSHPDFSARMVAERLGLSTRYINELLHQTGRSFTERVLELRLQKARAMLLNRRHLVLRIGDIALDCGFNEVSYFNRCFRRRFGMTPTQCRGGDS